MITFTFVMIPGNGASTLTFNHEATVSDLVSSQNLSNRDIIINGKAVMPANYSTTKIPNNSEVFATASVKGN